MRDPSEMLPRVRISIVMPVRNAAATLQTAWESIREQTFSDWELLVVEDGSTDGTAAIMKSALKPDKRVRVLHQSAAGICAAIQRGCAAATGDFIARMDADDWMAPERLGRQLELLESQTELGVVSCRVGYGGDESAQAGYAAHVAWVNSLMTPEKIALRRFVEAPVAHPSVMFRRELLEAHGGYVEGDFPEDYELWLRWLDAGVRFGKVDAELLTWNDPPGRLSRTEARYGMDAFYRIKCIYLARWLKRHAGDAREVWLWGAGRITRQRFRWLEREGIPIRGLIDVDAKKVGRLRDGRPVVSPRDLPAKDKAFIVVGVAKRGAREYITGQLQQAGRKEGADYLLAA